MVNRVWFITGVSSGFGRALAEEALARGDRVAATARNPDSLEDLVRRNPGRVRAIQLDVSRPEQVTSAVEAALTAFGQIDVVVNNAGYTMIGAVEEVSDAETRAMFETLVFGALSLIRTVLPHMRARRQGTIVNITSISGLMAYPAGGIYAACKHAIEGFSEALEIELKSLGIKVLVVEPGMFRTDFFTRSIRLAAPLADYDATPVGPMRKAVFVPPEVLAALPHPSVAARAILDALENEQQPLRLVLATDAIESALAKVQRLDREIRYSAELAQRQQ
ncbi:MAG: SDR family NAD(P)-dependent oxidoreductase [Steroidobacteraceae bacterium]